MTEERDFQQITWYKTRNGNWAVVGPANQILPGAVVEVRRRNGTSSMVRIVKTGTIFVADDGTRMAIGYMD